MKKFFQHGLALVAAGGLSSAAFAAGGGPDLTPLTTNIDFGTVVVAILAVAGLLATVYVAQRGASMALSMIKR